MSSSSLVSSLAETRAALGWRRVRAAVAARASRFVAWATATAETHHVSPRVLIALYVFSVIPFYLGIFLILWGSGIGMLSIRGLLSLKLHDLDFGSRAAIAGLIVNRLAWALPYLYIEAFGRNLRWYFHAGVWLWISLATVSIWW
jgi:hypothetical protein